MFINGFVAENEQVTKYTYKRNIVNMHYIRMLATIGLARGQRCGRQQNGHTQFKKNEKQNHTTINYLDSIHFPFRRPENKTGFSGYFYPSANERF